MAKTVIEIKKNPNENNASILRRFSRKVQESNIIQKVKNNRYNERKESKLKIKKSALKKMEKRNTKGKLPSLPFVLIKEKILGKNYSLSVAFINKTQSKRINNKYRKKNNPTNILSFPLSKKEGEILICPEVAKNETKKFNKNFKGLRVEKS